MYSLYLDKSKKFEANISIEGASKKNTSVRLVLERKGIDVLYKCNLDGNKVSATIKNLSEFFEPNDTGKIRCEVIADGMYFTPWEDDFSIKKSVVVESIDVEDSADDTPTVTLEVNTTSIPDNIKESIQVQLDKHGLTLENIQEEQSTKVLDGIRRFAEAKELDTAEVQDVIIEHLTEKFESEE